MKKNTKLIINIFIVVGCLLFIAGIVLLWRSGKLDPYINYLKKNVKPVILPFIPVDIEINKDTLIIFNTNNITINGNEYLISDDEIDKVYNNEDYFNWFLTASIKVKKIINKRVYKICQNNYKKCIFLEIEEKGKSSKSYILLKDTTNNNIIKFYMINK